MSPREVDLRRFFETAPVGMYRSTAEGRFVFVNPALVQLLGYPTAEDVLALDIARDVYADALERARLVEDYRRGAPPGGVDARWKSRTGRVLNVRLYWTPARGAGGAEMFDTTVFDVTELHEAGARANAARDELVHSEATLELLLGQLPAIVWTTNTELVITSSTGALGILGSRPNRTVGMSLREYLHTDDPDDPVIAHHRAALRGELVSYEIEFMDKVFAARLAPRFGRDGEVIGTIGTSIDVTASRALELRMVEAQRAESLGLLAGGLAHDFNNLLVAILGNADLALRDPTGGRDAIVNIRLAAMRAAELTQQLLAYAGGTTRAVIDVSLAPLVTELLALLEPTAPRGVVLHNQVGSLPPVRADASQLRQVILNLVTNAREAVAESGGEVRIDARLVDHDGTPAPDDVLPAGAGRYVVIGVSDDGAGIEPAVRARIFDPFFTTKASGHGLGLAAVLGIVRGHGGGLRVGAGSAGRGARFEVWWPASHRASGRIPAEPTPPPPLHVMVVDDEDMVRDVLARMVEDLGYTVTAVADGAAALAVADRPEVPLDAVILDLTMPSMGGRTVMTGLRARRPGTPIVLCSGYHRDHGKDGAPRGDAFLRKPFRMEDLEQILATVTRRA